MKQSEIIEVMALAMYEARFGNWRRNWKENWDDLDFDRQDKAVTRFQATEAYAALTAKGLAIVPTEVIKFDCTRYPSMELAAINIAGRISGKTGEKANFPDAIQVLEDAEQLFLAGMADHDRAMIAVEG